MPSSNSNSPVSTAASHLINYTSLGKQAPKLLRPIKGLKNGLLFASKMRSKNHLNYACAVEHAAALYPDNTLIKYNDERVSYREFNQRANQIAHYLISLGIQQGDVVALFMENRPDYLCCMAAITKTGGIAALINNSQTGKILTHSLTLVSAKAIIAGEEVVAAFDAVKGDASTIQRRLVMPDEGGQWIKDNSESMDDSLYLNLDEKLNDFSTKNPEQVKSITPDSPCLYVYTSGTTGLPKASIQKHKKIMGIYLGLGMVMGRIESNETMYSCLPLYHATALYLCWLPALANGGSIALRRKFSASAFWDDIRKYEATAFGYVGELCRYLINQPATNLDTQHNVKMVTGNGLRPDLWDEFKSRFGIDEVREFYGASEGNIVCYNLLNQDKTIGMTIGSYATVEFDNEAELPIKDSNGYLVKAKLGEPGLLLGRITKVTPFDGYTDSSKNNGKVFNNVFKEGDSWFNTGDIVKDIGFRHLQFVDRTGDTYRWKGENVSTTEVEMIVNQYPAIAESIAYGVEIPNTNGRAGMVAITLKDGSQEFDMQDFYDHLKQELPSYALPVFVRMLSSVDATGTFKYQRTLLKKESFRLNDGAYIALPGNNTYEAVVENVIKAVDAGEYRF
ncbi:MAG: long-chain-acyl-CoA synthetase [Pseudomonadales bacterium]|nr:long-chain-acyl-CoA synthetase [Pseudomonadales bacterium]